jgi:hypothetical protein
MDLTDCLLGDVRPYFRGFMSWFNLDERLEKPSNIPSEIHHGRPNRKEMTRAELQERIDKSAHKYAESHNATLNAEIEDL